MDRTLYLVFKVIIEMPFTIHIGHFHFGFGILNIPSFDANGECVLCAMCVF